MMDIRELLLTDMAGKEVKVQFDKDVRVYTLVHRAGEGKKAVTWKVLDCHENPFALKFVSLADYQDHSLEAELKRVTRLGGPFAKIVHYGEPDLGEPSLEFIKNNAYAIVVDWVDGETLETFYSDEANVIECQQFLEMTKTLCEALARLEDVGLLHNDLHEKNIMIVREENRLNQSQELITKIIDTGSLKSIPRRDALLENWKNEVDILEGIGAKLPEQHGKKLAQLRQWIAWFSRTDQEWVVNHLCTLVNMMRRNESKLPGADRRFLEEIGGVLQRMVDPDRSMRLDSPREMHQEIELIWKKVHTPPSSSLMTPFDLISAELIRRDDQLNELFSDKCPWFDRCATTDPVYIYGPRGCGKSTILRMLSLPAILASKDSREIFFNRPYIGVYISCTSELRSRFWLFPEEKYPKVQSDAITFFTMILVEALLETLELLQDGVIEKRLGQSVGLTCDTAHAICEIVCSRFGLVQAPKLKGISWLTHARRKLAIERNTIWKTMLRSPSARIADPSLIFSLCKELEEAFPLLKEKHIAFLLDDYSNQRIPLALQRVLNQTISFAKQGNPIFKVSSEYHGVDLEGIQEGREVVEVNLGKEYDALTGGSRSVFLEDVLNIRFKGSAVNTSAERLLGRSNISPGMPMARAIREAAKVNAPFYYYGIDTIADICSGDVAMALDLVKQIYVEVKDYTTLPSPISPKQQHEIIHRYADREHMYIRYYSPFGKEMSEITDALCWLAHEATIKRDSKKDGTNEPMIKTHVDIKLSAFQMLDPKLREMLQEMQRKGILFSLDTSRTRIGSEGTERYQVRRILLAKYNAPLGRRDPIKLDHFQRLVFLLTDPKAFCEEEATGQRMLGYNHANNS